jgi:hypothetical protein
MQHPLFLLMLTALLSLSHYGPAQDLKTLYALDKTPVYSYELKVSVNRTTTMKDLLRSFSWVNSQIKPTTQKLAAGIYFIRIIDVPRSENGSVFTDSLFTALISDSTYHPASIAEVLMVGRVVSSDGLTSTAAILPKACHYRKQRDRMFPPRFKLAWDKGGMDTEGSTYGATIDCGLPKVFGYSPGKYVFIKKPSN